MGLPLALRLFSWAESRAVPLHEERSGGRVMGHTTAQGTTHDQSHAMERPKSIHIISHAWHGMSRNAAYGMFIVSWDVPLLCPWDVPMKHSITAPTRRFAWHWTALGSSQLTSIVPYDVLWVGSWDISRAIRRYITVPTGRFLCHGTSHAPSMGRLVCRWSGAHGSAHET